ncbi:MAG: metallophosphoesterase [Candidatus Eisenbacteria sp.]|nr:metallophosphoesterase [Candidatus Eisenbacteria bacterium]
MFRCLFVSDLHGRVDRYAKLFDLIARERPQAVFLGGDLLPTLCHEQGPGSAAAPADFTRDVLIAGFRDLARTLGRAYPRVFIILGNDDPRATEAVLLEAATHNICDYMHNRAVDLGAFRVYGYACVPPTPFMLKDWERYDVSRFVDPGCVSPEEGRRSIPVSTRDVRYATIAGDLEHLVGDEDLKQAIFLFHSPPYQTKLDRAALDGQMVDHVPIDVHVGSIAIRRFIERHQPLATLHGHVHESARLTGSWRDHIGRTVALSAAHDGPELALVRFDPDNPTQASRDLY